VIDLRVPLGLLFVTLGLLLGGYGIAGDAAIYALSLGFNLNLWCGLAMLIFGIAMLALSRRGKASRSHLY
jgi:hypothetical protein